jgi:hypothetical protein
MGRSMLRPYNGRRAEKARVPGLKQVAEIIERYMAGFCKRLKLASDLLHLRPAHSQEWLCHATFSASCESLGLSPSRVGGASRFVPGLGSGRIARIFVLAEVVVGTARSGCATAGLEGPLPGLRIQLVFGDSEGTRR